MVQELILNASLLVALATLYNLLARQRLKSRLWIKLLSGLLFGGVAIAGMNIPFHYASGIIYDGRSIVLAMAGLFGGGPAVLVSVAVAGAYRAYLGGNGIWAGVATIASCALLGLAFRRLADNRPSRLGIPALYGIGISVHLAMLACQLLLIPWPSGLSAIGRIWLPVMLVFPIATVLMGILLRAEDRRLEAEAGLLESEERYRAVVELQTELIDRWRPDGTLTFVNEAYCRYYGRPRDVLIGRKWMEVVADEDQERVKEYMERLMTCLSPTNPTVTEEHREIGVDGSVRWQQWTDRAIFDEQDHLVEIQSVGRDITDRKQAEEALGESERRFHDLFENSLDAILLTAPDGTILDVNPATTQMFGRTKEDILQIGRSGLVDASDPRLAAALQERARTGEMRAEFTMVRADGTRFPADVTSTVFPDSLGQQRTSMIIRDISEHQQAEAALRESKEKFSTAFMSSPAALAVTTLDGRFIEVNKAYTDLVGFSHEELVGKTNAELGMVSTDDPHQGDEVRAQGFSHNVELRLPVRNGYRDVLVSEELISLGGAPHRLATVIDITERKQAEEAEREQRALAEALRDNAALLNSTLHVDKVLDLILANVGRVIEHDAREIMLIDSGVASIVRSQGYSGRTPQETLDGYRFPITETANLHWMAESGKAIIIPDTRDNPEWLKLQEAEWVRSYAGVPILIDGTTIGFLNLVSAKPGFFSPAHAQRLQAFADQAAVAIRNAQLYRALENYSSSLEQTVTERTAELQRSANYVATLLDSVGDGLMVLKPDGVIRQVNPAFTQQTGYTSEEVVGKHFDDLLRFEMKSKDHHLAVLESLPHGKAWQGEASVRRKNASYFDAALTISPVHNSAGAITLLVASIRDITPLKEVERAKDQFVSNVSHELRTPLTSIRLNHELMKNNPTKLNVYLERTKREIDRLSDLIENLLRLSRLDQGRVESNLAPVDLNQLVGLYAEDRGALAESKQITLTLKNKARLPLIEADEELLGEALSVLLTNALNYTPAGGRVVVRTHTQTRNGQRLVGFSVNDTGPGVPQEERTQLFQRFFRGAAGRKSGTPGTGLGLAIAKEIIDRHGGHIEVVSDGMPGKGVTFTVWLPTSRVSEDLNGD